MDSNINEYIIVGYSLEACVIARKMAMLGNKVSFVVSGKLGYPCDDINDFLGESGMKKISEMGIDVETEKISNGFYVHIPYDNLRMVNDSNGLIPYPLNRSSFESAEEWEQIQSRIREFGEFSDKINESANYINIYKKFLPKWLFESIVKYVGTNKWKLKQSQFTKDSLMREVNLSQLSKKNSGVIYRPLGGFGKLCKSILEHENITLYRQKMHQIKEMFRTRYRNKLVVFIDNRVDYICDYSMGKFDRVDLQIENVTDEEKEQMPEYSFIDKAAILTPQAEYWSTISANGKTIKVYSTEVMEIGDYRQNLITPSQTNLKVLNEYTKLFKRYPNKEFISPAPLTILI